MQVAALTPSGFALRQGVQHSPKIFHESRAVGGVLEADDDPEPGCSPMLKARIAICSRSSPLKLVTPKFARQRSPKLSSICFSLTVI